jgi:hypothetical protein
MAGIYWLIFLSCTEIVYAAFLRGRECLYRAPHFSPRTYDSSINLDQACFDERLRIRHVFDGRLRISLWQKSAKSALAIVVIISNTAIFFGSQEFQRQKGLCMFRSFTKKRHFLWRNYRDYAD